MQKNLVSVIMPVYNAEKYLEAALNSVLSQTYRNIEVICINDGSKDNSIHILKKFENQIVLINQENKGQCAASNIGIQTAKGDYIKFFDADDVMNPEHIELQVNKINGTEDAIASCEWGRFYDGNPSSAKFNPEPVWKDMNTLDWLKTALSQKADMMGAPLWLIPKNIIQKSGGWDERLSLNNDFDFSIRLLLQAKQIVFTPGAKVYYRSGLASNLSGQKNIKSFEAAILSSDLGCNNLLKADPSKEMQRICANRYQQWLFRIYPDFPNLCLELESKIMELGGSTIQMDGGKVFKILSKILGWKLAKKIQTRIYKAGYTPKHPHQQH